MALITHIMVKEQNRRPCLTNNGTTASHNVGLLWSHLDIVHADVRMNTVSAVVVHRCSFGTAKFGQKRMEVIKIISGWKSQRNTNHLCKILHFPSQSLLVLKPQHIKTQICLRSEVGHWQTLFSFIHLWPPWESSRPSPWRSRLEQDSF